MKTLHITKSHQELVTLLEADFPLGYDLKQYWGNIANVVIQKEKFTVEELVYWLRYLTILEVFPEAVTPIPRWLPLYIQAFLIRWRVRHLNPDIEHISKFYYLSSQFPLIVSLLTDDDEEFIQLFVQCQNAKR